MLACSFPTGNGRLAVDRFGLHVILLGQPVHIRSETQQQIPWEQKPEACCNWKSHSLPELAAAAPPPVMWRHPNVGAAPWELHATRANFPVCLQTLAMELCCGVAWCLWSREQETDQDLFTLTHKMDCKVEETAGQ